MPSYEEQLARVHRYLRRIENAERDQIAYEDDLWSFFQNCWHLKDWVKSDKALPTNVRESVEKDVQNFNSLMICAELANGTKRVERKIMRKDMLWVKQVGAGRGETLNGSESELTVSWEYLVSLGGESSRRALDIARDAIRDWKTLLSNYGLRIQ